MFLRWQHRKTAEPRTARHRPVDLTIGAQQPAAPDLALEAEARAVTTLLSGRPRRPNNRSPRSSEPRPSLVAVIVESQRVDGRPRQHLIRYVGSIDSLDVQRLSARRRFWDRADAVLAEFDPKQRERFEQALAAKVPRPTHEEEAAAGAAFAARYRLPIPATARAACRLTLTSDVASVAQPIPLERRPNASSG
jgi:hypothetical protein